jgi:hypothetical protein
MAHPILQVESIEFAFLHVHAETVTQDMHVRSVWREAGCLRVLPEEVRDEGRRNSLSDSLPTWKQMSAPIPARLIEVLPHEPFRVREEWIQMRLASLEPMNLEKVCLEIEVVKLDETGFRSAQRVAVDQVKENLVTQIFGRNHAEKAPDFAHREMLDLRVSAAFAAV